MKRLYKVVLQSSGFGILEAMVAAGLLTIGMIGVTSMVDIIGESRERNLFINGALAIESSLVSAFTDSASYNPGVIQDIQSGVIPDRIYFAVSLSGFNLPSNMFTINGGLVTTSYTNDVVVLERWRVRIAPQMSAAPPYVLRFAYAISGVKLKTGATYEKVERYDPAKHEEVHRIKPFGSKNNPFQPSDFAYVAPVSVRIEANPSATAQVCDLATTLGMSGFDSTTGNIECIPRPTNVCPPNTFSVGMVPDPNPPNNLMWKCSEPLKEAYCTDPLYALQSVKPELLFRHEGEAFDFATPPGTCRFIGPKIVSNSPATIYTNGGVKGAVCPPGYKLPGMWGGNCPLINSEIVSIDGECVDYTYTAVSQDYDDPATGKRMRKNFYKATEVKTPSPAIPGSVVYAGGQTNGWRDPLTNNWMIDCQVNIPAQKCGSKWSAKIRFDNKCELDTTFFPVTKAASYR